MSFLQNIGKALKAGSKLAQAVSAVNPLFGIVGWLVDAAIPGDQSRIIRTTQAGLTDFAAVVTTAEMFGELNGLKGEQKFNSAVPIITQLIMKSDLYIVHGIKDEALFKKAMTGYTQATVDFLNSLKGDKV